MAATPHARLLTPAANSSLANDVQKLGDSLRSFLGVLPYAAWDEAFEQGRVIAAVDDQEDLLGYVLFRTPRREVVVAHLAVAPQARGHGVASALIRELSARYPDRRGIRARCRRDFPANQVWPSLGFIPQGNLPGRGSQGQLLTLWWLDHGHGDLLSWGGRGDKVPVLLDTNVFIDLNQTTEDPLARMTRDLFERVGDRVELLVAPETIREINTGKNPAVREYLLNRANNDYPSLGLSDATIRDVARALEADLVRPPKTPRDVSDLRIVAAAVAADIPILVTRDRRARDRLAKSAYAAGEVVVTTPAELVAIVLSGNDAAAYVPEALHGTVLTNHEVASRDRSEMQRFIASGERRADFDLVVDSLAAASPSSSRQVVRDQGEDPVALIGYSWTNAHLQVALLRLQGGPLGSTLSVMMTDAVRSTAAEHGARLITVTDPHLDPSIREAFLRDGFIATTNGLTGATLQHHLKTSELPESLSDLHPWTMVVPQTADELSHAEHVLRPCRLVDAPLPTWLVSIRPHFADDLFGYPPHLLTRPTRLGLSLEQVYYRAGKQGEQAPGRILWRLAGRTSGAVFACSSLVEVRDGSPEDLHRRFRHLGVWTLEQIRASSPHPMRRALRVTDTHLLPWPVSLDRLRSLAEARGQRLQLQSPCRVTPDLFETILREGQHG
jgi:GNAT superfamily N-acetyltransferase/predicted nucleic acid-binding protein